MILMIIRSDAENHLHQLQNWRNMIPDRTPLAHRLFVVEEKSPLIRGEMGRRRIERQGDRKTYWV